MTKTDKTVSFGDAEINDFLGKSIVNRVNCLGID